MSARTTSGVTLDALRAALETLANVGYLPDDQLVAVPVMHDPEHPQIALAILESGVPALIPGTTMTLHDDGESAP